MLSGQSLVFESADSIADAMSIDLMVGYSIFELNKDSWGLPTELIVSIVVAY
jgi:hypothetical protein